MLLHSVELDFAAQEQAAMSQPAVYEQVQASPLYLLTQLPGLVVEISEAAYVHITFSTPQRSLNDAERVAMDHAFWRSVQVLDDGFED